MVYLWLWKLQVRPETYNERKNLKYWASEMASEECAYYQNGFSPRDAVYEELSCC